MNEVYKRIKQTGIIPVIKLESVTMAEPLGNALVKGGLPVAEVTFRADRAAQAIYQMKTTVPDLLVGAGTVLTKEQAADAIAAGAEFIVAPGFNKDVVQFVREKNIPVIPGVLTPSEIEAVMSLGIHIMKFFPSEPSGGLAMIKALSAPYSDVTFIPTGGINPSNLEEYLKSNKIFACGGSWMVKEELIRNRDFDSITKLCREAVEIKERTRK